MRQIETRQGRQKSAVNDLVGSRIERLDKQKRGSAEIQRKGGSETGWTRENLQPTERGEQETRCIAQI